LCLAIDIWSPGFSDGGVSVFKQKNTSDIGAKSHIAIYGSLLFMKE
jgi:hypothetical protein